MTTTRISNIPAYRRAIKALNSAIYELGSTRSGFRGRPTRVYVELMNKVATTLLQCGNAAVLDAFMDAARKRSMSRQVRRALARA